MKNYLKSNLGFIFVFCLAFYSCEKVIEIPLKDSQSLLVVEGNIDNASLYQEVILSKSTAFSYAGDQVFVSGAKVSITEDGTRRIILDEKAKGQYRIAGFKGKPGSTYVLNVEVDGQKYTATSTMPEAVSMDSIGTVSTYILSDKIISAAVIYEDPKDVENYYRFKVTINEKISSTYWVFDDRFTNGNVVSQTLTDLGNKLNPEDKIRIQMQCIDAAVYAYWTGLRGQYPGASTPANPVSNISNGALGYFSAHTISRASFEVK